MDPVERFGDEERATRVGDAEVEHPGKAGMIEGPQGAGGLQELLMPLLGFPVRHGSARRDRRSRQEVGAAEEVPASLAATCLSRRYRSVILRNSFMGRVGPSIPSLEPGHLVAVAPQVADAVLEIAHGSPDVVAVGAAAAVAPALVLAIPRPRTRRLV